jgi:hypothetical protein
VDGFYQKLAEVQGLRSTMSFTNLTETHHEPAAASGDRQGPKMVVSKARATAK